MAEVLPRPCIFPPNLDNAVLDPATHIANLKPLLIYLQDYNLNTQVIKYRDHNIQGIFAKLKKQQDKLKIDLQSVLSELVKEDGPNIDEMAKFIDEIVQTLGKIDGNLYNLSRNSQVQKGSLQELNQDIQFIKISEWLLKFLQANIAMQQNNHSKACDIFDELTRNNKSFHLVKQALLGIKPEDINNIDLSQYLPAKILEHCELLKIEAYFKRWVGDIDAGIPRILLQHLEDSVLVMKEAVEDRSVLAESYKKLFNAVTEKTSAKLLSCIGGELVALGSDEYALECLQQADRVLKQAGSRDSFLQLDIAYNMSLAYMHLENYIQVLTTINLLPKLLESSVPGRYSDILYLKAVTFKHLGEQKKVFEYFYKALEYAGKDSIALKLDSEPAQQLLKEAIQNDRIDIAHLLFQKFPNFNVNYLATEDNDSLLHFASNWDMFELLLEHKANILQVNSQGITPIYKVINEATNDGMIHSLIQYIKAYPQIQETILATASFYTSSPIGVKMLHELGWEEPGQHSKDDVFTQQTGVLNYSGNISTIGKDIFQASREDNTDLIRELIKTTNINSQDKYKQTALHYAVSKEHIATVQFLLKNGAIVDLKDEFGITPLHLAVLNKHTEIVQELLANKADPTIHDYNNTSPLSLAAEDSDAEMLMLLMGAIKDKTTINIQEIMRSAAMGIINRLNTWDNIKWLINEHIYVVESNNDPIKILLAKHHWTYAKQYEEITQTVVGDTSDSIDVY